MALPLQGTAIYSEEGPALTSRRAHRNSLGCICFAAPPKQHQSHRHGTPAEQRPVRGLAKEACEESREGGSSGPIGWHTQKRQVSPRAAMVGRGQGCSPRWHTRMSRATPGAALALHGHVALPPTGSTHGPRHGMEAAAAHHRHCSDPLCFLSLQLGLRRAEIPDPTRGALSPGDTARVPLSHRSQLPPGSFDACVWGQEWGQSVTV